MERESYYLYPSTLFVSRFPFEVSTVLGSCVAVCLYDKAMRSGGINHYMLPLWNGNDLPSPKFGNIAIEKLIEKMTLQGSDKRDLIAKVFGGWNNLKNASFPIGDKNVLIAHQMLKENGIPIISEHTGGAQGRTIRFQTDTGDVYLKLVKCNLDTI